MNSQPTATPVHELPPAGQCLAERCRGLRVPWMLVDGRGRPLGQPQRPLHQLGQHLLSSPAFHNALAHALADDTADREHGLVELWPGCWILALPLSGAGASQRQFMLLALLTERFLATDQYRLVCDQAHLDAQSAAEQARRQTLMSDAEVRRLAALFDWMVQDIQRQQQHDQEIEALSTQLAETYEELSLLYKVSAKMTVTQEPPRFLEEACTDLQQGIGVRWLALQLSETDDRLNQLKGLLQVAGQPGMPEEQLRAIGRELLHRFHDKTGPTVINDVVRLDMPPLSSIAGQLLLVPLRREKQTFGILYAADKTDGTDLSSIDSKLAQSVAQNIGIFLDNAMLYEDQHDMFMGTLRGLVNAIDAKDSYTCGHSERVAMLSRRLAEAAGLDEATCDRLYLSGLVHDVGKIGIPEAVLTKPGKLTNEEYAIIKTHPLIGVRILQDIRQMQDLLAGVRYHHERYDGKGYPEGLSGDNIPLYGRVIALADSFDAMSSDRTYRRALPLEHVLEEIRRCAAGQFDPHLAGIFVQLDFSWFQDVIDQHRQRTSPLHKALGA